MVDAIRKKENPVTYWTILLITLIGEPLGGLQTRLVYKSAQDCFDGHKIVSDTLRYDHKLECQESDIASGSIRPKRNPRYKT
jgi:hypothetical protein